MKPDFEPIFRNAHLLTIAGNFWPRKIDERRFPGTRKEYRIDDRTTIIGFEHQPSGSSRGQIVLIHGLEGCADAGYIASLSQEALLRGFGVHRINLRTCGGTEGFARRCITPALPATRAIILQRIREYRAQPAFLVGFSLGGNVALKLAGELGATELLTAVCAVSTPIDLAACVRAMDKRSNLLYVRRFLKRLRGRVRLKSRIAPHLYSTDGLDEVRSIWEFDDRFTAPLFGFGTAENYYATQSASRYLDAIRVPTLAIYAKDDPLVPFEVYDHPAFRTNPALSVLATQHGGHLGFFSRRRPRFWLDGKVLDWIEGVLSSKPVERTNIERFTPA